MKKEQRRVAIRTSIISVIVLAGLLLLPYRSVMAANDREAAQGLVDKAKVTFKDFMNDPNYTWIHENIDRARGVLIFPQVFKGGFIFGASGGTGVFMVRDSKTGNWSDPAFYTVGSGTFGLQIGGEASEVMMVAMTQKAVDSLLSSSFKLGGDVSVAIGPVGMGAKANATIPNVTADFISFAKSKGLYAGLNLEGTVVAVRDSLNRAYYGKYVRPAEILVAMDVSNHGAAELRGSLKCKC